MRYINRAAAKAGLKYRVVEGLSDDVPAYIEGDTIVYNAKTLDDPEMVQRATAHEVYHSLLGTDEHSRLMDMAVDYYIYSGVDGLTTEKIIAAKRDEYAAFGVELDDHAALDEIGADFMEIALADERVASRILTEQPNLAQRILQYIQQRLSDFRNMRGMSEAEKRQYAMLRQAQALYEQGLKARNGQGTEGARYQIKKDRQTGKRYVDIQTDQHIFTNNPRSSYPSLAREYILSRYVGKVLDVGEYDAARVTKQSAGEYAYTPEQMADRDYTAKLRASTELGNLLKASEYIGLKKDKKNHPEATLGWDYYKVYFKVDGLPFTGVINIANSEKGRVFYDITNIKELSNTASDNAVHTLDGFNAVSQQRSSFNASNIADSNQNGKRESPEQQTKLLREGDNNRRYMFAGENLKKRQFEAIQSGNPMQDDYHTGIRSADGILTFDEAVKEGVFTPDYTEKMAQEALRRGRITVYSSYPIAQGVFVTPSKMEAQSYPGGGRVYSKTVDTEQVAWIDSLEGQYADVGKRYTLTRREGGKSRFEELLEQYGAIHEGEAPRTDSDHRTPRQTAPGNKVCRFGRNAMEAPNVTDDAREGIRRSLEDVLPAGGSYTNQKAISGRWSE